MDKLVVDPETAEQFAKLTEVTEVRDNSGKLRGHFFPACLMNQDQPKQEPQDGN
jgi:hypothetical protein